MYSKKSIKLNYLFNLSYQILILIIPLITTPYISRVIGVQGIGIYSYTASIASFFSLFAVMGTTTFGQREISYVQNDEHRRSVVFWENVSIRIITSCIILCIYLFFALYQKEYRIVFIILGLNIIAIMLDVSWFFQGMEEFGKIVGRNVFLSLLI